MVCLRKVHLNRVGVGASVVRCQRPGILGVKGAAAPGKTALLVNHLIPPSRYSQVASLGTSRYQAPSQLTPCRWAAADSCYSKFWPILVVFDLSQRNLR